MVCPWSFLNYGVAVALLELVCPYRPLADISAYVYLHMDTKVNCSEQQHVYREALSLSIPNTGVFSFSLVVGFFLLLNNRFQGNAATVLANWVLHAGRSKVPMVSAAPKR